VTWGRWGSWGFACPKCKGVVTRKSEDGKKRQCKGCYRVAVNRKLSFRARIKAMSGAE